MKYWSPMKLEKNRRAVIQWKKKSPSDHTGSYDQTWVFLTVTHLLYVVPFLCWIRTGRSISVTLKLTGLLSAGCKNKKYGMVCPVTCSSTNCGGTNRTCNKRSGSCVEGCQPGYHFSLMCNETCDNGTYGLKCLQQCHANCKGTCDLRNGRCSYCPVWLAGKVCDKVDEVQEEMEPVEQLPEYETWSPEESAWVEEYVPMTDDYIYYQWAPPTGIDMGQSFPPRINGPGATAEVDQYSQTSTAVTTMSRGWEDDVDYQMYVYRIAF
ncbi:receptor-type tyrosine-protein phosphatase zeta [Elysia marginata]|uniref:Receptor-type tyrosine-protein phosphatase zeta n=1 Tax=Elysia marginata TaxID=1093978 RepID=A0AAV4IVQ8_9GAST|nr:receptor-type tyrosine-protein phosphatase zeta [Elysia marginata]